MMKKYQVVSYDNEPTAFFGHICYTEPAETLKEAKVIAKKCIKRGDLRVSIRQDNEGKYQEVLRYADKI
jgi:hypothetical protein